MSTPLLLTEVETAVLVDLLERELSDLPVELHHTRTREVREDLRRRREMLTALLRRLQAEPAPAR